jgi:hypothetical protein
MAAELTQRWCEYCRDYYDVNHYDVRSYHRVGTEYGPTGLTLWQLRQVRRLATRRPAPADWQARLLAILDEVPDV